MGVGFYFSVSSFVIICILIIIFYSKNRINNIETKIYKYLLFLTLFGLFLEIITCIWYVLGARLDNFGYKFVSKITSSYYMLWGSLIVNYLMNICNIKQNFKKVFNYYNLISFLLIMLFPISYKINGNIIVPIGMPVYISYINCFIYAIVDLIICLKNRKKIVSSKLTPIYSLIGLGGICILLFFIAPSLFLIGFVYSIVVFIMYHTIENPDMKLLEEMHKAKEISDNANEEKTLFVYNMTQEIRNITSKIDDDADIILDSKDWNETYDTARDIKANTSKFINMTNDILDVSNVESTNIKTFNNKYNIKNILKQIINVYTDICKNKELKFRTNIDHDIPEFLYGDGIGLKEVLTTIINNSAKYTDNGYIEFDVNTIIKNDICRLIFTIEDSGIGIKSEDINKIKIDNKSLAKANKLITLMNGTMLISSDYGIGTKVKVIIDQKICKDVETEISKYEKELDNIKILAVDDSESGLKIIEKILKGTNIKVEKAMTGKECIDKIKVNKYDLILLDEELSQISGSELLKKIKDIRNFKTPVVLLTKDNSYEYNDKYIKDGFIGYILKPLKKDILINKINEYIKK